jgi:uncharacterized protein
MIEIGKRAELEVLRDKQYGLYLDGGELGEILLPHGEVPRGWDIGQKLDVFLYLDSEDRLVATLKRPRAMVGEFARLKCVAVTAVGAFLEWGLTKDLMVPFREQKMKMEEGRSYLVKVLFDGESRRLIATARLARHLNVTPASYAVGDEVELIVFEKTDLGYKTIINHAHEGLLYANEVFQGLSIGEKVKGWIAAVREDGKIDVSLHAPGRGRVDDLEKRILGELVARGGFWGIGDHTPADEIREDLGVSKRTFKQALGALLKKRLVRVVENGIRLN